MKNHLYQAVNHGIPGLTHLSGVFHWSVDTSPSPNKLGWRCVTDNLMPSFSNEQLEHGNKTVENCVELVAGAEEMVCQRTVDVHGDNQDHSINLLPLKRGEARYATP